MLKRYLWSFLGGVFLLLNTAKSVLAFNTCSVSGSSDGGIETAIGCVPIEINSFITWLLGWLFGVAGGIAFVLMVFGFIMLGTSSGDEKKMAGAKETITSAIMGLLVSIFAVFILRLIAVDILKIPGIN